MVTNAEIKAMKLALGLSAVVGAGVAAPDAGATTATDNIKSETYVFNDSKKEAGAKHDILKVISQCRENTSDEATLGVLREAYTLVLDIGMDVKTQMKAQTVINEYGRSYIRTLGKDGCSVSHISRIDKDGNRSADIAFNRAGIAIKNNKLIVLTDEGYVDVTKENAHIAQQKIQKVRENMETRTISFAQAMSLTNVGR
ncbi:MAG: hypothetical protein IJ019_06385 [Alphaproteobacteria bacterium]|nr:hypothetical protein [Alphaproteobacteria bacterium]